VLVLSGVRPSPEPRAHGSVIRLSGLAASRGEVMLQPNPVCPLHPNGFAQAVVTEVQQSRPACGPTDAALMKMEGTWPLSSSLVTSSPWCAVSRLMRFAVMDEVMESESALGRIGYSASGQQCFVVGIRLSGPHPGFELRCFRAAILSSGGEGLGSGGSPARSLGKDAFERRLPGGSSLADLLHRMIAERRSPTFAKARDLGTADRMLAESPASRVT